MILLCALPLIIMLIAWVAARSSWTIAIGGVMVLSAAVVGGIWGSRPVTALIIGKSETLQVGTRGLQPAVTRRLVLIVVDDPATEPAQQSQQRAVPTMGQRRLASLARIGDELQCEVSEQLFDAVSEGDHIPLHRVKWGPVRFGWPATATWRTDASARLRRLLPGSWATDPLVAGQAQVAEVRTVRDADVWMWGSTSANRMAHFPLPQPYDEVRLRFVTSHGAQILALDRIDAGSAGALAPGSSVAIQYPPDQPRMARLANGQRRYAWRNARAYWGDMVLLAAIGIALFALAEAARRWFGRRFDALPDVGVARQARSKGQSRES